MKPDEHKKKRSAQYKKKHNLTGKNQATKKNQKSNEAGDDDGGEDGSAVDGLPQQSSSQFSKRKVTSNWEKYEEPVDFSGSSDDEEGTACSIKPFQKCQGADFTTLVKTAAAPSSQFRFQSEKEWEETDSKLQSTSSFLEFNLALIAKSLQSLPLHKKLLLDVENIQPDLLEIFNSSAGINNDSSSVRQTSAKANLQHVPSQNQPKHSKQPISSCHSNERIKSKDFIFTKPAFSETDSFQNYPRNVDLVKEQQLLSSKQRTIQSPIKDAVCDSSSGKSLIKMKIEPHLDEDDELDQLLTLDTPIGISNQAELSSFEKVHLEEVKAPSPEISREEVKAPSPEISREEVKTPSPEISREEVKTPSPEISCEGKTVNNTQQPSETRKTSVICESKTATAKAAANQDELEDWLDSVLG